jgi:hypothetical protein
MSSLLDRAIASASLSSRKKSSSKKGTVTVVFHDKDGNPVEVSFREKPKRPDSALTPFQLHMRRALTGVPKSKLKKAFKDAVASWSGGSSKKKGRSKTKKVVVDLDALIASAR